MGIEETAAPLEILWASIFTIAAVNFAVELRQCLDDSRNLERRIEDGELTRDEATTRRVYVTGSILVQICNMVSCLLFAASGYYLMFVPNGGNASSETGQSIPAIIVSLLMILAGMTMVVCSFVVRIFTRRLRHTLIYRRRQGTTGQYPAIKETEES